MSHSHGGDGHTHDSQECMASDKYTGYISSHLEQLRVQCDSFTACIKQLLLDESALLVLKGEDISLNKTCGLVYKGGHAEYYTLTGKCTLKAREEIREDIEKHLKDAINDDSDWSKIKRCLSNQYGKAERTTYVDEICGLAAKKSEICGRTTRHRRVESFFNEQIQHLKCTCESLTRVGHSHMSKSAMAGAIIGGVAFMILLAAIGFWCYRRRRAKKKKKSPNVIYLPAPNTDNHPVYQEVFDDRPYQAHGFSMSHNDNPPTLPMRYVSHPKKANQHEEPAYLEPVEVGSRAGSYRPALPRPRGQPTSNPNYDAPPEYTEREPKYFEPVPTPPHSPPPAVPVDPGYDVAVHEDPGYAKLDQIRDKEVRDPPDGYDGVAGSRSSIPLEEAPRPVIPEEEATDEENTPLGPKPAERTKKPDRQTESHYFLLEEGSQKKHSEV